MDNKKTVIIERNFSLLNSELVNIGATYSSLLVFNNNNEIVLSKSSDKNWSEEFTSTGMYKNCHLLKEANEQIKTKNGSFIVIWDLYNPYTNQEKELDEIRKYRDIVHGVGFCFKDANGNRIMLNIAGKYSDINFGLNVLKNRPNIYKALRQTMILC